MYLIKFSHVKRITCPSFDRCGPLHPFSILKRKKSTFPPLTISKVWFSFFNYRTGYLVSPNCKNHMWNRQAVCFTSHGGFMSDFCIFNFLSLFSLNWGCRRGSKIIKIGIVVEESIENPISQFFEEKTKKIKFEILRKKEFKLYWFFKASRWSIFDEIWAACYILEMYH